MPVRDIARVYDLSPEEVGEVVNRPFEPLCVDDMELLRDDDHRYELWDGELWRMSPTKKRHGRGAIRIVSHMVRYLDASPIGALYIAEVGFRVGPRRTLVCPDAAYVSAERDAPVGDDEFFPYAPDIAVEVLSPDNTWPKVRRKAGAYLASGAGIVWAIDPRRRTVTVYPPGVEPQRLTGEGVLPGFAVRVADLF
jgi:Uma2 family endonuclease